MEAAMTQQPAIVEKIKKLLAMAKNGTEHEAALAATRAAELMSKYQIEEATIRLDTGREAEPITEESLDKSTKKKVAWKGTIASGLCSAFGTKMWWHGAEIVIYGRKSALQTVNYMYAYLCAEVERLAGEVYATLRPKDNPRTWLNAFRLGAASTISNRLRDQRQTEKSERVTARKAAQNDLGKHLKSPMFQNEVAPECRALAIIDSVEQDEAEVEAAYTVKTKGFRTVRTGGRVRNYSGWAAGSNAGGSVSLATGAGRGLNKAQGKLR